MQSADEHEEHQVRGRTHARAVSISRMSSPTRRRVPAPPRFSEPILYIPVGNQPQVVANAERPLAVQRPSEPVPPPHAPPRSARSEAQRHRREREHQQNAAEPQPAPDNTRSAGQRRRRERERLEREQRDNAGDQRPLHVPLQNALHRRPWEQGNDGDLFCIARRPYREPVARHDLGRMNVECGRCGALHWMDEKRVESAVTAPEFGCCKHGEVQLPPLQEPPQLLRELLESAHPTAKAFRSDMWKFNRVFAFTSLGVLEDHSINRGNAPPVFRILGELCHRTGSLTAAPGRPPIYAQLYIYDPRAALEQRVQQNEGLNGHTIGLLQDMLLAHNPYAAIYRHAHHLLEGYDVNHDVSVRLRVATDLDHRRYNLPTADEVAVILPDGDAASDPRDIHIYRREGPLRTISNLHPAYTPLYYVLLFPRGEPGWHPGMLLHQPSRATPKRMTLSRFVTYRIQVRRTEYSTILRAGRLFQRFIVDMYASIDSQRLSYLKNNQSKLRAALYGGLEDALADGDDDINLDDLGQRIVLPSSYIGGPRDMQQRFQDSMAIARYYRKVDIFLTATCNPRWDEITQELLPTQSAYDRPDLVGRVFELKKKAIVEYIYKLGIFGQAVAHVYVVEFQKRGLPHMHLLTFLKEPFKLLNPDAIDSCIWACWPDPDRQPLLFDTVKRCMVHGPCGAAFPNAPCMVDGKCSKGYPKQFQEFTTIDAHGYPAYACPCDGRQYLIGNTWVDNRWIVPYSPYLSAMFDCHINVECAASVGSFKYLFKYIQKGGDRASVQVNHRDEIQRFINGRYISASEAIHRVFSFKTHDQIPNVVRLQVHLPGQHMVVYDPVEDPNVLLERAASERTPLTAFFAANADDGELGVLARSYTYQEFPQHFVWKDDRKSWAIRQRGFGLGRMYFVGPTAGERFYLRTLLTVVKGPTSYRDLLTYNGVGHLSFHAACLARGLLEDDGEWRLCLQEATQMQTGFRLRHLFATILLFCEPSQPDVLWNEFRQHICDDLRWRLLPFGFGDPSDDDIYDYGLFLLEKILNDSGHRLDQWPSMPLIRRDWGAQTVNALIAEQLQYNHDTERRSLDLRLPQLNAEQSIAYHQIIDSISNDLGKVFFLNGAGGTGKMFVYNTICNKVRSEGGIILCVASSGIAALLMPGGRTAHSMLKIPVNGLTAHSFCEIDKKSPRADLLRMTKAIIWDEVGAQNRFGPEAVDRTCRDIRGVPDRAFGGITAILAGDFLQTLPVVPKASREEIIDATLQHSPIWDGIELLCLSENMRVDPSDPNAQQFSDWLLDVGHGRLNNEQDEVPIPDHMLTDTPSSLIDFIYAAVDSDDPPPPEYFQHRMILAPRNSDVGDINNDVLDRMAGNEHVYYSADRVLHEPGADSDDPLPMPVEFLRSINSSSLPLGELKLKMGCPLILLRNLSPSQGLCNGTRMVVSRISDRVLECRVVGGDHDGELVMIPRVSLSPTSSTDFTFQLRCRQFPVRLAFALTINKSQGQSVKYVGIDLRVPVFAHGQLYVALSRATSSRRIKILLSDCDSTTCSTKNVVYPEVLLD